MVATQAADCEEQIACNISAYRPVLLVMPRDQKQAATSIAFENWDLALFDRMLREYVVDGDVDYAKFKADDAFSGFIEQTGRVNRETLVTRQHKLSFYINAYNALVIRGIIDGYSPARFFGRLQFFLLRKYRIAGERLSLFSIERNRIIPLGDPRSHFAINCASASCPILASESFNAEEIDQQLETAAARFVRSATATSGSTTRTSRIFKWYKNEFDSASGGVAAFISRYAETPPDRDTTDTPAGEIQYDKYDWSLNGKPPT